MRQTRAAAKHLNQNDKVAYLSRVMRVLWAGKAGGKKSGVQEKLGKRQINMKTFFLIAVCHSSCSCCVSMTMATSVQNNMPATMRSCIAGSPTSNPRKTTEIIMKEPLNQNHNHTHNNNTCFSHVKAAFACKTHTTTLNFPTMKSSSSSFYKRNGKNN